MAGPVRATDASARVNVASHPRVHAKTAADWRRWLAAHHETARGVWLVSFKAATGKQRLSYDDSISEALCYGWIDSVIKPLDDTHTALLFTPRRLTAAEYETVKTHATLGAQIAGDVLSSEQLGWRPTSSRVDTPTWPFSFKR